MALTTEYTKTYSTYSGCDIVPSFNGKVIGEIQGITYSISREKAPVYTMGSAEPRSFSRGKRGIAGTMVFATFARDALIDEFNDKMNTENLGIQKFKAEATREFHDVSEWDAIMSGHATGGNSQPTSDGTTGGKVSDLVTKTTSIYADEILPFDITITFANEYGSKSVLTIFGVEILNEGSGFSVDNISSEKAYTFVARRIDYMKSLNDGSDYNISASW